MTLLPSWWPPRFPEGTSVPGSGTSILSHPAGIDEAVQVAVFKEHRFAFSFWAEWTRARRARDRSPAHLVSLDFHQDLCWPSEPECEDLRRLDLASESEVALFAWSRLNPLNDGHIFAAAYVGLIQDIFVLCKTEDDYLEEVTDLTGQLHRVVVCHSVDELLAALPRVGDYYFDIDLDFFTERDQEDRVRLVNDEDVLELLSPGGRLGSAVLPRLSGMTIATEPEWCGGLGNSHHLFGLLDQALFDPPLLCEDTDWNGVG